MFWRRRCKLAAVIIHLFYNYTLLNSELENTCTYISIYS